VNVNLNLLCDIEVFYGLSYLLPMLESMNNLIKLAQAWNVFVVDYVKAIRMCQANLFMDYVEPNITFKYDESHFFKSLVDWSHELLHM
jgi:hypothetical protein